jgi:hypothetical protein
LHGGFEQAAREVLEVVVGRSLVVGLRRVEEALLVGDVCFDRFVSECLPCR